MKLIRLLMLLSLITVTALLSCRSEVQTEAKRPNIILVYADDISARELPIYGSSVWTKEKGVDTSDEAFRAKTPVLMFPPEE